MPIYAKASGGFIPAPEGTHAAICVDVIDHGTVEDNFQGKVQQRQKITVVWQIANMDNGDAFLVRRLYTCSLHEKATLRKHLESWRGRAFTEQEIEGFDFETLLFKCCLVEIIHVRRNGLVFANVARVIRWPKDMIPPTPRDYVRVCDRPAAQAVDTDDSLDITDADIPF
jgi:hypothetical protein